MRRYPDPQHLWWQSFCSCRSRAMEQFTATSQRCWLTVQSVPTVTKDIFVTPPPVGGRVIVIERFLSLFLCFFVSLSVTLGENGWTDLHEIFREGVEWTWDDLITFWVSSGKRVGGSKVKFFVITGHSLLALTSQLHRWQQGAGFVVPRTTACLDGGARAQCELF